MYRCMDILGRAGNSTCVCSILLRFLVKEFFQGVIYRWTDGRFGFLC